jgi:Flp pilus assembly pilin Flp
MMSKKKNEQMDTFLYRVKRTVRQAAGTVHLTGNKVFVEGLCVLRTRKGQGTTEYAILVGVLVVVAIIAVVAFRGKLQELWDAISTGINSL